MIPAAVVIPILCRAVITVAAVNTLHSVGRRVVFTIRRRRLHLANANSYDGNIYDAQPFQGEQP